MANDLLPLVLYDTARPSHAVISPLPANLFGFLERLDAEDEPNGPGIIGDHGARHLDPAAEVGPLGLRGVQVDHPADELLGISCRDIPIPAFVFAIVGNAVEVESITTDEVDGGHGFIFGSLTVGWKSEKTLWRRPNGCYVTPKLRISVTALAPLRPASSPRVASARPAARA